MNEERERPTVPVTGRDHRPGAHSHDSGALSTDQLRIVAKRRRDTEEKLRQHQQQAKNKTTKDID